MAMNLVKLPTGKSNLQLRVSKGHYATSHSHINYYIDVTLTKFRLSEARAAAAELVREYKSTTIVDTILCLDGTEVIGACMASELTKAGYTNMNAHQTIYVVTPEHTTGSQLLFRENTAPMIAGKQPRKKPLPRKRFTECAGTLTATAGKTATSCKPM